MNCKASVELQELLSITKMLSLSVLLLFISMATMARPPNPDEIKELHEQQLNDSKDDYDMLPDVGHIPESFKESLKKQKMLYLDMLRQQSL
ncbi:Cellulose synthase-like protein [Dirofilaria immitis]